MKLYHALHENIQSYQLSRDAKAFEVKCRQDIVAFKILMRNETGWSEWLSEVFRKLMNAVIHGFTLGRYPRFFEPTPLVEAQQKAEAACDHVISLPKAS